MNSPVQLVSAPAIARLTGRTRETFENHAARAGIAPDAVVEAARGPMHLYRAERLNEILAAVGPLARPRVGNPLVGRAMF